VGGRGFAVRMQNVCRSQPEGDHGACRGPGGYSGYTLIQITSFGFVEDNFWAIVDGVVASIAQAHSRIKYMHAQSHTRRRKALRI
jgi:hypothetical protein